MIRVSTLFAFVCVSLLATAVTPTVAIAQPGEQRFDSRPEYGNRYRYGQRQAPTQYNYQNGWYQRPYPYHLDYYRMRYGGSYAPYFGNLYGPPRINNFGPMTPFYGGAFFW